MFCGVKMKPFIASPNEMYGADDPQGNVRGPTGDTFCPNCRGGNCGVSIPLTEQDIESLGRWFMHNPQDLAKCIPEIQNEFTTLAALIEELAAGEHEQWCHWVGYMLENSTPENVERWQGQITHYSNLKEEEKDKDREWAYRAIKTIFTYRFSPSRTFRVNSGGMGLKIDDVPKLGFARELYRGPDTVITLQHREEGLVLVAWKGSSHEDILILRRQNDTL